MKSIQMSDLQNLSKEPSNLLVDVRSPEEFQEGHVPGAVNIPHTEVLSQVDRLKRAKQVVIYCRSGGRASMAAQDLSMNGVSQLLVVTSGGMPQWESAGLPISR